MSVNLDGAFFTLRAGARFLAQRDAGGSLVAVTSTSTIHGAPFQPHYAASKTALLGLVRSMAVGLARYRIRVNALSPGWTDTDLLAPGKANQKFVDSTLARTPVRRWADLDEFAAMAVYLADPDAHLQHRRRPGGRRRLHHLLISVPDTLSQPALPAPTTTPKG
jgi:NAD(P)-dependent dehydrogenase (short-subunit alcohol dehydrogenase family)